MADYIADLRKQMQDRLKQIDIELRGVQGLLDEKARIERALEREPFTPAKRAHASSNASGRRQRPRRGDTQDRFVAFVGERPGVSVAEVSKGIDIASSYGHNMASRLTKQGVIERFELPSGTKGLRLVQQASGDAT